jgi:hypothetical protein
MNIHFLILLWRFWCGSLRAWTCSSAKFHAWNALYPYRTAWPNHMKIEITFLIPWEMHLNG